MIDQNRPMMGARRTAEAAMEHRNNGTSLEGGMRKMDEHKEGYGRVKTPATKHAPGTAAGDSSLSGAVGELHKQHPYKYYDHGPHRSHTPQPKGDK